MEIKVSLNENVNLGQLIPQLEAQGMTITRVNDMEGYITGNSNEITAIKELDGVENVEEK